MLKAGFLCLSSLITLNATFGIDVQEKKKEAPELASYQDPILTNAKQSKNMKKVVIYSKSYCGYCKSAKKLLEQKGISYNEIEVDTSEIKEAMVKRAGGAQTVPQIFINDQHIGGFDDLEKLDQSGELDKLLNYNN